MSTRCFSTKTSETSDSKASSSSLPPLIDSKYDEQNNAAGITGSYQPKLFESDIYKWWEEAGCFQPDAKGAKRVKEMGKDSYVLPMPPPNVTGRLHMGHAMFVALQDILARFHRMRGRPVLWLPGTDHAGIATQLMVERELIAEGTTREEVGRETFLDRVWEYKAKQGGFIPNFVHSAHRPIGHANVSPWTMI